jgi:hypothetical protein
LAWEIGFFEREKEKAPSSRRTPKFPLGYSPTTPANARVQARRAIAAAVRFVAINGKVMAMRT